VSDADRQIGQAVKRFEAFHGFAPGPNQVGAVVQDGPGAGLVVGELQGVIYKALGEKTPYIHRFRAGTRPELAVSHTGKQSYIIGGDYEFTGRGFVDAPKKGTAKMPGQMLVINPLPKAKGTNMARTMSAKQKKYFGGGRRHHKKHRTITIRAKRNPRPFSRARAALSRRSGLGGLGGGTNMIRDIIEPAAIGAAGAFGIDYLWSQLPVPDTLQSGVPMGIAKIALSIGVGMAVGMVTNRRYGNMVALGGAVVAAANMVTDLAGGMTGAAAPAAGGAALNRYIANRRSGVSRYVAAPKRNMGYVNPGVAAF
jgi:hypothetical protein